MPEKFSLLDLTTLVITESITHLRGLVLMCTGVCSVADQNTESGRNVYALYRHAVDVLAWFEQQRTNIEATPVVSAPDPAPVNLVADAPISADSGGDDPLIFTSELHLTAHLLGISLRHLTDITIMFAQFCAKSQVDTEASRAMHQHAKKVLAWIQDQRKTIESMSVANYVAAGSAPIEAAETAADTPREQAPTILH